MISCNKKEYSYGDAVRSLKVLNSDMVNFFSVVSEKEEFEALQFLWEYPSSPVPYKKEKYTIGKPYRDFDYDLNKGFYKWNDETKTFLKQKESDNIQINFPLSDSDALCRFVISSFKQEEISSRPGFPVDINAHLKLNSDEKLKISHSGRVEDDLPKEFTTIIDGEDFNGEAIFFRSRNNESGTINFNLVLKKMDRSFITLETNAEIGYSSQGYYFKEIDFKGRLFNHYITGKINYGNINPTSDDYVESWNSNSEIELFEMPLKRKVGDILLGKTSNGELQDYFIRFSNGNEELLSFYLAFLERILNFKY
jgi:hypothetical protein